MLRPRVGEVAAHARARQAREVAFHQIAFGQLPTQLLEGRLALHRGAEELTVLVIADLELQMSLRQITKTQHVARLDGLGEQSFGRPARRTQR